jgi:diguanylate cyclase (GGDEF)-like protein
LFTKAVKAATRRDEWALSQRLARAFAEITPEQHRRILKRWFVPARPIPSSLIAALILVIGAGLLTVLAMHFLHLRRTVRSRTEALRDTVRKLEAANESLDRLAHTDPLTGIANRLAFFETAEREIARARRHDRPLSLAVLDLDRFKAINDRYGHHVGDAALRHVVNTIGGELRASDLFARVGGEELVIALPETGPRDAKRIVDRLLATLKASPLRHRDEQIAMSFSAGVAGDDPAARTVDELLRQADAGLYRSKAEGRSRVTLVEDA